VPANRGQIAERDPRRFGIEDFVLEFGPPCLQFRSLYTQLPDALAAHRLG